MRPWRERLQSRKFWTMVVAAVFSVTALAGFDMPIEEVALVDACLVFYAVIEGIIDATRK